MDEIFKPYNLKTLINHVFEMDKNNPILRRKNSWKNSLKKFKETGEKIYPNHADWKNLKIKTEELTNDIHPLLIKIYDECVEIAESLYFPKDVCYID